MAKINSKHVKNQKTKLKKKHYNKAIIAIAFVIMLIFIIVINSKNTPKTPKYSETEVILNNENITEEMTDKIIVQDEKIYMSINDIKEYLDNTIYIEESTDTIITTNSKKLATFKIGDDNITINNANQKIKDVAIEENNLIYLQISSLSNVYNYELEYISDSNILTIDSISKKKIKAYAKKELLIKDENVVLDKVSKGNWIIYIGEEEGIAKVRTQKGYIGEVKKSLLDNFVIEREDYEDEQREFKEEEAFKYDITDKDLSTFEKRKEVIDFILQEAIKNDNIYVKLTYSKEINFEYERFKIEVLPILNQCGITVDI